MSGKRKFDAIVEKETGISVNGRIVDSDTDRECYEVIISGKSALFTSLEDLDKAGYEVKKGHNQDLLLTEDGKISEKGLKWISNQTRPELQA